MLVLLFLYFTLLFRSKTSSPVISEYIITVRWRLKAKFDFFILKDAATHKTPTRVVSHSSSSDSGDVSDRDDSQSSDKSMRKGSKNIVPMRRPSLMAVPAASRTQHFGSFYLRMGAVGKSKSSWIFWHKILNQMIFSVFGIGSMIYSGLELGQYFEIEKDSKCHNYLLVITPGTRITFIFIQMYFIFFLNNEVKYNIFIKAKSFYFKEIIQSQVWLLFTTISTS